MLVFPDRSGMVSTTPIDSCVIKNIAFEDGSGFGFAPYIG